MLRYHFVLGSIVTLSCLLGGCLDEPTPPVGLEACRQLNIEDTAICCEEPESSRPCEIASCSGRQLCGNDFLWGECIAIDGIEDEVCDGRDNDCDGSTDELLDTPPGERQDGVCVGAQQICNEEGMLVPPDYASIEGFEDDEATCDGLDNDCDGEVDEDCECNPDEEQTRPCGDNEIGECERGEQLCENGTWGECVGAVLPSKEICDGLDNDCNGEIDEIGSCECRPGDTRPCGTDEGLCSFGTETCGEDYKYGECDNAVDPVEEVCDGLDNDCDTNTDEGLNPQPSANQQGVCFRSVLVCDGPNGWQEPNFEMIEGYEANEVSCDGLDNDCDGRVDEGLGVGDECALGEGFCRAEGVFECDGNGGVVCDAVQGQPQDEICDRRDNDCDGETDEEAGCECKPGSQRECGRNVGVCFVDFQQCVDFQWGDCVGFERQGLEECDGLDNDCDTITDEELRAPDADLVEGVCRGSVKECVGRAGWQEPLYNLIDGYEMDELSCDGLDNDCDGSTDENLALGEACEVGVGECARQGVRICDENGGVVCSVDPGLPAEEECDGLDNNCDGQIDEELRAPLAENQNGVCEGAVQMCAGADRWQEPDYGLIEGYEADEATCDATDNDCDGQIDEAFNLQEDILNCGACNQVCADIDTTTDVCVQGACRRSCENHIDCIEREGELCGADGLCVGVEEAYLRASNAETDDRFGTAIAMDGNRIVIGAPWESEAANGTANPENQVNETVQAGAAYVFEKQPDGNWLQTAYLKASNASNGTHFGGSVDIQGTRIVVGADVESSDEFATANRANNGAPESGAIYVFDLNENTGDWDQIAFIKEATPRVGERFGFRVSLDGNRIAVGAPFTSFVGSNAGVAYVLDLEEQPDGTWTWTQANTIRASNEGQEDQFGFSIALEGDRLIVGALNEDNGNPTLDGENFIENVGAAYVFELQGGRWIQTDYLKATRPQEFDRFGYSVDIEGDRLAVSAINRDGDDAMADPDTGAVYIFEPDVNGRWIERYYINNNNGFDRIGSSIALEENYLLVGAHNSGNTGRAYLYEQQPDDQWALIQAFIPSNGGGGDRFGEAVTMSGQQWAIGSKNRANLSGAMYIYSIP